MVCGLLLIIAVNAQATFPLRQTENVPISRLLKNLHAGRRASDTPEKMASLEFKIGRLHSMAYARKTEELQVFIKTDDPDHFNNVPDWEAPAANPAASQAAAKHLRQAVVHLRRAGALAPRDSSIKLGLGWCLERSGDKAGAIKLYREIVASDAPAATDKLGFDSAVVREAAGYLTQLLDAQKDSAETASLQARIKTYTYSHPVTPIIVPLAPNLSQRELTSTHPAKFDVDGLNRREFQPWPTAKAGWLVWDPKHTGKIASGLQLFGSVSFWLFWDNGYEALRALDDDHNGKLDGGEREGLAIWQDLNSDGISQKGEVKPLSDWGIVSISYQALKDAQGMWYSPNGVRFASGETRPTYDLILTEVPPVMKTVPSMPHPMMNRPIPATGGVR